MEPVLATFYAAMPSTPAGEREFARQALRRAPAAVRLGLSLPGIFALLVKCLPAILQLVSLLMGRQSPSASLGRLESVEDGQAVDAILAADRR